MAKALKPALLACVVLAVAPLKALGAPAAGAEAVAGQKLFMAYECYACHGSRGSGGAGPPIAGKGLFPAAAFEHQLRHPNRMPAYSTAVLSADQVDQIYAYLKTIPASAASGDIPELQSFMTDYNRTSSSK